MFVYKNSAYIDIIHRHLWEWLPLQILKKYFYLPTMLCFFTVDDVRGGEAFVAAVNRNMHYEYE